MWQSCLLNLNIKLNSVVLGIENSCSIIIVSFDVPWVSTKPIAAYYFILLNLLLYIDHCHHLTTEQYSVIQNCCPQLTVR
uniref:Uncharacterized protein n=1 Tax=Suricata suricatta TaxID=37032 RepID=A0A673UNT8_SURSU